MSSQTYNSLHDKLRRSYASVLIQISGSLTKDQLDELVFYWAVLTTEKDSKALDILRSLENTGKISWENVSFLKDGLRAVQREDLCKFLTVFEIERDLSILLNLYARKRSGTERSCGHALHPAKKVVDNSSIVMNQIEGGHYDDDIAVGSLVDSTKNIRKVLVAFEKEVERELRDPWSRLTLLVVIAGETVASALAKDEIQYCDMIMNETLIVKLCCNGAEELCSRMIKMGTWEEFCDHVEEQYYRVSCQDESSLARNKIAEVVQKLKETRFFQ
ncbi:uncharacterized protein [Montipora capricornis]|uniref:uncharacterized protein n=1 Tax=Montipora capricornis TaxID=246305 RepID=UPI0035F17407